MNDSWKKKIEKSLMNVLFGVCGGAWSVQATVYLKYTTFFHFLRFCKAFLIITNFTCTLYASSQTLSVLIVESCFASECVVPRIQANAWGGCLCFGADPAALPFMLACLDSTRGGYFLAHQPHS